MSDSFSSPVMDGASSVRRGSDSMLPPFMVSAPGKVIVYGEHAVVHGKAAIAASISLRSYLLVTFLSKTRRTVSLRFPDIGLDHTWNVDTLPWEAFRAPEKRKTYYDTITALDADLIAAIHPYVSQVSPTSDASISDHVRKIHQASATCFLYLFLSLSSPRQHAACVYTLRSTIPVGAGLGSSASIAVCLSASLLLQVRALSGPHPDQPGEEAALQIARINAWAFVGELAIHGNPSGVDNTVSAGGKAVLFRRRSGGPPDVRSLRRFPELPLLLVDSRQPRTTAAEVAKVGALKAELPDVANPILDAIDAVAGAALALLEDESFDDLDPARVKKLGKLAAINHGLLVALGVSHPKLERIRAMVDSHGLGWTKLTGAGGGGCAITILNPEAISRSADADASALSTLCDSLETAGFAPFTTTLAGNGVGVLWPAVLHNASGEEGGDDIDQEKFLRAKGIDGIEALVGVGASSSTTQHVKHGHAGEGWRFWRT